MTRGLEEWVEYMLKVPGKRYDLSSIARYHPQLSEIIDEIDMERFNEYVSP